MNVSRKLVEGVDTDGNLALFVVAGNPTDGYDLFRCRLERVEHYRFSWQAVEVAHRGLGATP